MASSTPPPSSATETMTGRSCAMLGDADACWRCDAVRPDKRTVRPAAGGGIRGGSHCDGPGHGTGPEPLRTLGKALVVVHRPKVL